jgi:hypothetical protein
LPFDVRVPIRILLKDKFKLAMYSFQKVQAFCDPLPGAFDMFSAVSCHNQPSVTFSVDTYTADNTTAKGVAVTVDGYKISAEVNVSTAENNQLELKDDGVYAAPLEWQTIE